MASGFNLMAFDFTSNDLMYVIAFSDDYIAIESIMDSGTVGGPNRSSILLVNISTGETEEDFTVSVNPDLDREYEEYNEAEISELNKSLRKDAYDLLEELDFNFKIIETELPGGLNVSYEDRYFNPEQDSNACLLKFSITHEASGKSWAISERVEMQRGLKSDNFSDSLFGPAYTQILSTFTSSDQENFVILYKTPFLDIYDSGNIGGLVIDDKNISYYLNDVGLGYYYKGKYVEALKYFKMAFGHNIESVVANYNAACMSALLEDVDGSIKYLEKLRIMGNPASIKKLNKAKSDSDFDLIRGDDHFLTYLDLAVSGDQNGIAKLLSSNTEKAELLTFKYSDPKELLTDWLNTANMGNHSESIQYFKQNPIEKDGISFKEYSSWINSKITRNKTIRKFDFIAVEYFDEESVRIDLTIEFDDKTEITKWVTLVKDSTSWMLTTKGSLF